MLNAQLVGLCHEPGVLLAIYTATPSRGQDACCLPTTGQEVLRQHTVPSLIHYAAALLTDH